MSNLVQRLIDRLRHGSTEEHTVMILGLDYSGKTTLLYLLKLNEVVEAIPSIGVNVESIDLRSLTRNSRPLRFTGWDIGTGCDRVGKRFLGPLVPMYLENAEAVIWVVDSGDKNRLEESVALLTDVINMVDNDAARKKVNPTHGSMFPILILANKSDQPNTLSLDQIRIAFAKTISGRLAATYSTSLTSNPASGLSEAFEWLSLAFDISQKSARSAQKATPVSSPTVMPNPRSPSDLAQRLESWLHRSENDTDEPSDDGLLAGFHSFNLSSWDHYTHIRLAYVILSRYGRKEGKAMLFDGLEKYIASSANTSGKTFHLSMTYFWIQIVHFGIIDLPPDIQSSFSDAPIAESSAVLDNPPLGQADTKATLKPFSVFLLINPHVADSSLWSEYYSKSTLMSTKAKSEMVLPDKKPFPNLVVRDAIRTFGNAAHNHRHD